MLKSIFSIYILFHLLVVSSAFTLHFWTGQCNQNFMQCGNLGYGSCCTAGGPFCRTVDCDGCQNGNDLYGFGRASCSGAAGNSCREPGCCVTTTGTATCAGQVFQGGAPGLASRSIAKMGDASNLADIVLTKEEKFNCKKTVKPNSMSFVDAEGQEHHIHIPAERFDEAIDYFLKDNWTELKKFDKWNNQKYEDYEITVNK